MFELTLYVIASSIAVAIPIGLALVASGIKRKALNWTGAIVAILAITPFALNLVWTAMLPAKALASVREFIREQGDDGIDNYVVVRKFGLSFDVYAISHYESSGTGMGGYNPGDRCRRGIIYRVSPSGNGWVVEEGDAVWASEGSADGNTFPPYIWTP